MDTLKGIPEHIEADFGDSIVTRDEAVAVLGSNPGLGPPDLCWLQKCQKRSLLGSAAEAQGYYHYVLGRDVSSSAAVAAYFALLNSKVEPCGMLQGLWLVSEYVIQRGFYCCYDPLSRMDLRCELCVPGGVVVGCVDAAGVLHDVTPQLWMQAQVCSFVRALLYDPEMRLNGGSVIAYDPCPTPGAERSLLGAVLTLYSSGALPGALQDIYAEQGCGVLPEHMDVVLAALWQHFRRRQRWAAAASFFRQLADIYSPAALLLAAANRAQGLGLSSGGLLAELLLLAGHSRSELPPATLVGLANELLDAGQVGEAADLARQALQTAPRCRPAWLLLAQCFIAEKQYAAALVALNVVPTPPLPAAEVELLHVVPPPPPRATTHPQSRLYDGEVEGVRCQALEEASLDGSRLLAYLPGSILVNREPLGAALTPDTSPNRITRSVLAAVYMLLQDIVSQTSWDTFLEIRSRVFLMQHETGTPRASQELQHQQHQHQRRQSDDTRKHSHELHPNQHQQQHDMAASLMQKLEALSAHDQYTTTTINGSSALRASHDGHAAAGAAAGSVSSATPPSRGRLSSSGGQRGSPKSYYANKLQEELHKPATAGGGGISSSAGQQQQQQSPAVLPPAGALPRHQQQQLRTSHPGEGERSMAGRVLLLGRTHTRRVSGGGPPPPSPPGVFGDHNSVPAVGCGVPRSLAPNEVEDLSRLATASRVAPIRTAGSITPQLWDVVFGAARSPPAAGSRRAMQQQQQREQQQQEEQDATDLRPASANLPRIRTRPLGESRLHRGPISLAQLRAQQQGSASMNSSSIDKHQTSEASPARCSCKYRSNSPEDLISNSNNKQRSSSSWMLGCFKQPMGTATPPGTPNACSRRAAGDAGLQHMAAEAVRQQQPDRRPGPLAEGLDRTGSLLLRTSSSMGPGTATAAAAAARALHSGGGSINYGSTLAEGNGSGNFGASLARRASLAGEAVSRTLESDREGLIKGWVCDDASAETAGSEGAPGRRLCVRWLDELIVALWHDLQAYMEWKVWDHTLRQERGGTHADLVLGLVPGQSDTPRTPVSDAGATSPPALTSSDWMRRGGLAERLGHVSDARAAYRAAVKLHFNLTSYLALLRLEAQAGNASDALLCAAQVLAWHQQRMRQAGSAGGSSGGGGGGGSGVVQMGVPPEIVGWALGLVADSSSLEEVAAAAASAPAAVKDVLAEWAKWQRAEVPQPLQLRPLQ